MEVDPLSSQWEDLFRDQSSGQIRAAFEALQTRKTTHKTELSTKIGEKYSEIIRLAESINELKTKALENEKAVDALSGLESNEKWTRITKNMDLNHTKSLEPVRAHSREVLAKRLLGFAETQLIQDKYVAAARSLYLCRELGVKSLERALKAKEVRLAAIVDSWIDDGLDDSLSQEMLSTYVVTRRVTPSQLVHDFLSRRQEKITAKLSADYLAGLDLVESTIFSINHIVDYFFNFKLASGRLIDSPDLDDRRIGLTSFVRYFDDSILTLQAFPKESYEKTKGFDTTQVQKDFEENVTKAISEAFKALASGLQLNELTKTFSSSLLKIRDSAELKELQDGEIVSKTLFHTFQSRFETLLSGQSKLGLDTAVLSVQDTKPKSFLRIDLSQNIEDLTSDLFKASNGQVGPAGAALTSIVAWGTAVEAAQEQISGLDRMTALVEGNGKKHIEELKKSSEKSFANDIKEAYSHASKSILDRFKSTSDVPTYALLATVTRELDTQATRVGLKDIDASIQKQIGEKLAQKLVDDWTIGGTVQDAADAAETEKEPETKNGVANGTESEPASETDAEEKETEQEQPLSVQPQEVRLAGLPSPSLLRSLFTLAESMQSVIDGFEWPQSALEEVRARVQAKAQAAESDVEFITALFAEQSGVEAVERTRLLLRPLSV